MKTSVLACCLLLTTPPAFAGGLDLAWDTCAIDGGLSDAVFDCADENAMRHLFATFVSDVDVRGFTRLDFVMDMEVDAPTLPDFWLFLATTGPIGTPSCNFIDHMSSPVGCPHAPGVMDFVPATELESQYFPYFGGASNRGRLVGIVRSHSRTLYRDRTYYGFLVRFFSGLAAEAGGPCAGCTTPATIVLNQITLSSDLGPPVVITGPGMVSNCVTVSGGGVVPCGATPTKRSTWGTIKALYR